MTSTGSPLSPEGFRFVYEARQADVHLASISGGTDIVSCFVLGDPTAPVYPGEIQAPGLGLAVDVWDDDGRAGARAKRASSSAPRPSRPCRSASGTTPTARNTTPPISSAFASVWHHGDFAEWTAHGGIIIHGRSDATLNPGGVRIGTAELYAQVEKIAGGAGEPSPSARTSTTTCAIVLFVRLREGVALDEALTERIKRADPQRRLAAPRAGQDPRRSPTSRAPSPARSPSSPCATSSPAAAVKNQEALANPEALELYRDLPDLRT